MLVTAGFIGCLQYLNECGAANGKPKDPAILRLAKRCSHFALLLVGTGASLWQNFFMTLQTSFDLKLLFIEH